MQGPSSYAITPYQLKASQLLLYVLPSQPQIGSITSRKRKGFYLANIIGLLKREKKEYVGIIQINKNFAFARKLFVLGVSF